jgi:hypothetical protein
MTIDEYNLLNQQQQAVVLYNKAVYVGKHRVNDKVRVLYQLENFYVEVSYHKYRYYIDTIECTTSTAILNPYLDQVDISELEEIFVNRSI